MNILAEPYSFSTPMYCFMTDTKRGSEDLVCKSEGRGWTMTLDGIEHRPPVAGWRRQWMKLEFDE